jgi:hypothetical protein
VSESFADPHHPAILLVMGTMASMLWWPDGFCRPAAIPGSAPRAIHGQPDDPRQPVASNAY